MKLHSTEFEGLYLIETNLFEDDRGQFQKLFNFDEFHANKLCVDFKEFYFSISHKNVIRGMHFQIPPFEHEKLVYVSKGKIIDVVVDLRKSKPTYGKFCKFSLDEKQAKYLYIPKGMAHGFLSLTDHSIVNYAQSSCYNKECDAGIAYDSFGMDWNIKIPIMSERDRNFQRLESFSSPF